MIDLHVHSTFSDGKDSVEEIVKLARTQKITHLALTDHDTLAGLPLFLELTAKAGINGIAGCEISIHYPEGRFHMLAYNVPYGPSPLSDLLKTLHNARKEHAENVIKLLQNNGYPISLTDLQEYNILNNVKTIGKPHIARLMHQKKIIPDIESGFIALRENGFAYYPRFQVKPEIAIEAVKKSGGLTFLAHPYTLKIDDNALDTKIKELAGFGLDGVECHTTIKTDRVYRDITQERTDFYKSLAIKYNLKISGGSDYHGTGKPGVMLGYGVNGLNNMPIDIIENIVAI